MGTATALHEPTIKGTSSGSNSRLAIGIAALIFAAHGPLLFVHFQQLWLKPHYQLFPLVLCGTFVLLWPLDHFSYGRATGGLKTALGLAGAGIALSVIGMLVDSMPELWFFGSASIWVALGGILLFAAIPVSLISGLGVAYAITSNAAGGMYGAILALILLMVSVFFASPAGGAASLILLTGSLAYTAGGWPLLRRCLPAILYLFLIVPPPFGLDTKLVQNLQVFAAWFSSKLLDQFGLYHLLSGVQIEVGGKYYMVEDACSGISSLLSTLACVLFYVIYFKIHWLRGSILTLSAVGWVIVNNTLRIIGCTFFGAKLDINLSKGIPHTLFGILLFGLTLLLLWSTDRFLMFFGRSDPPRRRFEPMSIAGDLASRGLEKLLHLGQAFYRSMPLAVLFGLLLGVQVAERVAVARIVPYSGSALSKLYKDIEFNLLPEKSGGWLRVGDRIYHEEREHGNPLGQYSQIWRYARNRGYSQCLISLDYPYPDFHDLRVCYSNTGWRLTQPELFKHPTGDGRPDLHCVRVGMLRPVEQYAYLWFCEFDQDGVSLDPFTTELTQETVSERIMARIWFAGSRWQRIFRPGQSEAKSGLGSVLQVQLLFQTKQEKPKAELDSLNELFLDAATKLRARCVDLKNGKK